MELQVAVDICGPLEEVGVVQSLGHRRRVRRPGGTVYAVSACILLAVTLDHRLRACAALRTIL